MKLLILRIFNEAAFNLEKCVGVIPLTEDVVFRLRDLVRVCKTMQARYEAKTVEFAGPDLRVIRTTDQPAFFIELDWDLLKTEGAQFLDFDLAALPVGVPLHPAAMLLDGSSVWWSFTPATARFDQPDIWTAAFLPRRLDEL